MYRNGLQTYCENKLLYLSCLNSLNVNILDTIKTSADEGFGRSIIYLKFGNKIVLLKKKK